MHPGWGTKLVAQGQTGRVEQVRIGRGNLASSRKDRPDLIDRRMRRQSFDGDALARRCPYPPGRVWPWPVHFGVQVGFLRQDALGMDAHLLRG